MPSSTSSFDRPVPERPWLPMAVAALALALAATAAWELQVRRMGYVPDLNDTDDLWALHRDRVRSGSTVVIGSSRTVFDLDLDVMEEALGTAPIHLGLVGSCPRPVLADLAADEEFRGTLLVGVTPGLFFAPGGPPVEKSNEHLKYRRNRSPSQRAGHAISRLLEARLAFLNDDDLALKKLVARVPLSDRPGAKVPPRLPPYLGPMLPSRSVRMSERLATDESFQKEVQAIWKGLAAAAPPMDEAKAKAVRERVLHEVATQVRTLRGRGARVVFLRLPSTGYLRELEEKALPRRLYWDALLSRTGAPGIHFEDHPELRGFPCPEWSHLSAVDATRYTRAMMPILEPLLADRPATGGGA